MTLTITFGEPENITTRRGNGIEYYFPFTIVPVDLKGTPEEKAATEHRRVLVSASRTRLAAWQLPPCDLVKVLFWFGKGHVCELITSRTLPNQNTIRMPMITTASHPDVCPFDPAAIPASAGFTIKIDQQKPKIGF